MTSKTSKRWFLCGILATSALLISTGAALPAGNALRAHLRTQQAYAAASRGPLVQAWQEAGLEMQLEAPRPPFRQDRRLTVVLRGNEYSRFDPARFGTPVSAEFSLNGGEAQGMVFVDAPVGEPDYFEGWMLATELDPFTNSGVVVVRNAAGKDASFQFWSVY
jgi:hypothetical protein